MPHHDFQTLAAEIVPGCGALDIELVSVGLINETYRVVRDAAPYAMRVASGRELPPELEWESRILKAAGSAGLAPPVVYCDPGRGVLLVRWISGRSWQRQDSRSPEGIGKIAALLRRVHALDIRNPARTMNPKRWIEIYTAALSRHARPPPDPLLQQSAAWRLAELAELARAPQVLCHSDLHAGNVIQSGTALILLDWEYAHVSDPLWDAAGWSANNDFGPELQQELLMNYLQAVPTATERTRFSHLRWLYDYICLLWSELYLSSRRDPDGSIGARATQLDARLRLPANYPA